MNMLKHFTDATAHAKALKIILGLDSPVHIFGQYDRQEKKEISYIICFDLPCNKSEASYFKNYVLSNLVQFGMTAKRVFFTKNKLVLTVPFEALLELSQHIKMMVNSTSNREFK